MVTTMRNVLFSILALLAVFVSTVAKAATETVNGYTWTYEVSGDSVSVEGISPKPTGSLTIPSTLGGKPVTEIGYGAFWDCTSLTSVTIPSSVTSIGGGAFSGCGSLTSVTISEGVTSIGWYAFSGCRSLTSVTIPSSVTFIDDEAFADCRSLTSVRVYNCLLNLDNAGIPNNATITIVHNEQTTISAIEPTCTTDGRTAEVVCSRCGVTVETSTLVPALGGEHIRTVTKPAVQPTSGTDGCTEEIACSRCGTILQASEAIPALGYIRNVTARQIWPHKKVEVCYEVAEDIGDISSINSSVELSASYAFPAPVLSSTGSYAWAQDKSVYKTGSFSYKSGNAGAASSSSTITTTVTYATAISFYWKVSSESGYDKLHFYVDGIEKTTAISGTKDWTLVKVSLDSGTSHELKWTFTKDGSVNSGKDCGWIDGLEVTYPDEIPATTVYGDTGISPGRHVVAWDFEADSINIDQTNVTFMVSYSTVSGTSDSLAINTSSSVADGMSVSGPMNLDYSPFADGEVTLLIDSVAALSTTNSGLFAWTPCTTGSHTLKHVTGAYTWTRTVNVTETTLDGHDPHTTVSAIEPTCTTDGRTAGTACSRCGVTLETSTVIPALGHDEVITKPAVEPTTETEGRTAEISCSRCHKVLQAQTTIPALTDPSVDPSDPDDNDHPELSVTNLMIRQRYPWNGLVDIDFTIRGESVGDHLVFSISVKDIAGATNLPMRTVYKADGTMVNPDGEKVTSGTYRWVWDAAADLPDGFKCERVRLEAKLIVE